MKNDFDQRVQWLLQEKYNGRMPAAAKKDIARLRAGEPLDHLIGFVEFLGCKILVGPNVLIPRFETEFWVEEAITEISNFKFPSAIALRARQISNLRVLDMFAGSGCIGISIMRHMPNAHVTFVDSEKPALEQIKKSCAKNKIAKNRYEIMQSDVFSNVQGTFDYIFANPPYIPTTRAAKIQNSVIKHEPHAALFGGKDGLDFVRRFLAEALSRSPTGEAKNFLNPNGRIFMEFDSPQKLAITNILKKEGYKSWQFHKDQYNRWRWITIEN